MRRLVLFVFALLAVSPLLTIQPTPAHAAESMTLNSFILDGVSGDIDGFWRQTFSANGLIYTSPRIRLMTGIVPVADACDATPVSGHHYCDSDSTIYLDTSFSNPTSFGDLWSGGDDFAIVTILAHEWGHHIQHLTGAYTGVASQEQLELQADCYSGAFAGYARERGWLDPGDLDQGLTISLQSGDSDHGSGTQRADSFTNGYLGGVSSCSL